MPCSQNASSYCSLTGSNLKIVGAKNHSVKNECFLACRYFIMKTLHTSDISLPFFSYGSWCFWQVFFVHSRCFCFIPTVNRSFLIIFKLLHFYSSLSMDTKISFFLGRCIILRVVLFSNAFFYGPGLQNSRSTLRGQSHSVSFSAKRHATMCIVVWLEWADFKFVVSFIQ